MREKIRYGSVSGGTVIGCRWLPEGQPKAVLQIVHGIAEYIGRYDEFATFMNEQGIAVVGEDHMGHGKTMKYGTKGYFDGGWMAQVENSYALLKMTREAYPDIPYILFGHSMGSFLVRSMLIAHPDSGITAAIICGTGWQPRPVLKSGKLMCKAVCAIDGEKKPSVKLENLVFGGYNKRVEHPRTAFDWLSRDNAAVDAYIEDPLCGFTASAGLLRDMLDGMDYNENPKNLALMNKAVPVLFIAGGDDPVGNYGAGVKQTADAFVSAGVESVKTKIFPLGRHEILNEINKQEVYEYLLNWVKKVTE